jgi:hypothetical protein
MTTFASSAASSPLCDGTDLRLLANVAFLAVKMRWQEEADEIFAAVADASATPWEVVFAWIAGRCELGDGEGAAELLERLRGCDAARAGMVPMAECCVAAACGSPEWMVLAQRIVRAGPGAFGYETAQAMLSEQGTRSR